jgi:hypothetical protein
VPCAALPPSIKYSSNCCNLLDGAAHDAGHGAGPPSGGQRLALVRGHPAGVGHEVWLDLRKGREPRAAAAGRWQGVGRSGPPARTGSGVGLGIAQRSTAATSLAATKSLAAAQRASSTERERERERECVYDRQMRSPPQRSSSWG